jgi:hypothetical protein
MDFVEISYGGGVDHYYFYGDVHDYVYPNISVDDDAKLTLTNTIVSDSDVHGLAIASNGTVNGIETSSTTIIDDISAANTFQNNTLDIVVE